AKETGLFRKHGLDVMMIFTSGGSLGIQAMVSGDVAINVSDGAASVGAKLSGIDNVMFASFLNTFPYSLILIPELKQVSQLKGTSVAVSRFGSATDLGVRMALGRLGLNADKDVTMLQIGAQTARFTALQAKQVQSTIITPPFTLTARKLGYNTLIDMAQLNIPYQLTCLTAMRGYIKDRPDIILAVVEAVSEAIHYYKTEKAASLKILSRYLKTDDMEALDETYREVALKTLPEKPYPSAAGIQTVLDEYAKRIPKAKTMKPEEFMDSSFVKKLDDEKFYDRLYKR
ncbi:MAG TPA: ABC transporter substrate-binding protein, partial [Candidatus Saccharimonadales bacterium]|nr:ABC transporter substrate-binding protein [Candidatus Saccharimonadales bacterium]